MTNKKTLETSKYTKSICVFCGASQHVSPHYFKLAEVCGQEIANNGYRMIYGGGSVGLMGTAARAAHDAGGAVLGVIPKFLMEIEDVLETIEHEIVEDMHERKHIMYEESDAFIVLPGGIGTLEEAIEILSWMRLHLHAKPMVFVDTDGYWAPLMDLLHHTITANFSPAWVKGHLLHEKTPRAALAQISSQWANPPHKGEIQISQKISNV
jgi:uncharacterized protein (TIGR00730 family)